jgi:hypothetical protein
VKLIGGPSVKNEKSPCGGYSGYIPGKDGYGGGYVYDYPDYCGGYVGSGGYMTVDTAEETGTVVGTGDTVVVVTLGVDMTVEAVGTKMDMAITTGKKSFVHLVFLRSLGPTFLFQITVIGVYTNVHKLCASGCT